MKSNLAIFRHNVLQGCVIAMLLLCLCQVAAAQTYVDQTATGNNDGSSWADAYTELADALDAYSVGDEIWVAAGTYLPQVPATWPGQPKRTFFLYQDVQLYGGFAGTETQRSERDPEANPTILSGDLNGDDVSADLATNRTDNVNNVMFLTDDIGPATVIDGFIVSNGHADGPITQAGQPYNREGGGMWAAGSPTITNCRFTQNYALTFGGGLLMVGSNVAQTSLTHCVFEGNQSVASGGGMVLFTDGAPDVVTISHCDFLGNRSDSASGGGLLIQSSQAVLDSCQFDQNAAAGGGGGILYLTQEDSGNKVSITGCQFTDNLSLDGAGFYYGAQESSDGILTLQSCVFSGNRATITALDSLPDGGAIAIVYGLLASPGAPATQRDSIRIRDCVIEDNTARNQGGGLVYGQISGVDNDLLVDNCQFIRNSDSAREASGAGMGVAASGQSVSVRVSNTLFDGNAGPSGQGFASGGVSGLNSPAPVERNIELVNCLFVNHPATSPTSSVLLTKQTFSVINCTFADNQSPLLGTVDTGYVSFANTLLVGNEGPVYAVLDTTASDAPLRSLGGNLVSDSTLDAYLDSSDLSATDPLFEPGTYQLSENSPAVDAGVVADPRLALDYAGNPRVQGNAIDIGAFESPYTASTVHLPAELAPTETLRLYPNPCAATLHVSLTNPWRGSLELAIWNNLGQRVRATQTLKTGPSLEATLDLSSLPPGVYRLSVSNDQHRLMRTLIKAD